MDIAIRVEAPRVLDEVSSLRQRLAGEDVLRGRVRVVDVGPEPGALGAVTDTVAVAVGAGGAATVGVSCVAAVLINWLQSRRGDVSVTVTRSDGARLEYTASRVQGLDFTEIGSAITALARDLDRDAAAG